MCPLTETVLQETNQAKVELMLYCQCYEAFMKDLGYPNMTHRSLTPVALSDHPAEPEELDVE